MEPRTVRFFLVDGSPSGMLLAEIMNFSGKVVVVPRTKVAELEKRTEAGRVGLYFLVGEDPHNPDREVVYIGETDNILKRLVEHDTDIDKDYSTRVAFAVSTDENLTKGHVRYLESLLITEARSAQRAVVKNRSSPTVPPMPESDRADMLVFINQLKLQLAILGFNFLKPINLRESTPGDAASISPTRFLLKQFPAEAIGMQLDDEFVVLKGSSARAQGVKSWTAYKALRERLVLEGMLKLDPSADRLTFVEDVPFKSPSAAASVVLGRSANGRVEWKLASDTVTSYGDWDRQQIEPSA